MPNKHRIDLYVLTFLYEEVGQILKQKESSETGRVSEM